VPPVPPLSPNSSALGASEGRVIVKTRGNRQFEPVRHRTGKAGKMASWRLAAQTPENAGRERAAKSIGAGTAGDTDPTAPGTSPVEVGEMPVIADPGMRALVTVSPP